MSANPLKTKRDWIVLRVTAILSIPLVVWFVYNAVALKDADYATATTWIAQPLNAILLILSIIVVFYHAGLGVHEIVEDYVHHQGLKKAGLLLKKAVFILLGAACIYSVLKIAL